MPVRALSSSVLKWPDAQLVDQAVRSWAYALGRSHPKILKIGYIAYARSDWGVCGDVDILILVSHSDQSVEQRSCEWNTRTLPVPADVLVDTLEEWQRLPKEEGRFYQTVTREVRWVFERIENESGNIDTPLGGS